MRRLMFLALLLVLATFAATAYAGVPYVDTGFTGRTTGEADLVVARELVDDNTYQQVIGRMVTTLILTLAYYLVITPTALIMRVFGGRSLPLKPDRNISSYWVPREEPAQPREQFLKRH